MNSSGLAKLRFKTWFRPVQTLESKTGFAKEEGIDLIPPDDFSFCDQDSGLKTRHQEETKLALTEMVSAAKALRASFTNEINRTIEVIMIIFGRK